jgi:hypothetical protein
MTTYIPGFKNAILSFHVEADHGCPEIIGTASRLYYCADKHSPHMIRELVGNMRKELVELSTKLAAVEQVLIDDAAAATAEQVSA